MDKASFEVRVIERDEDFAALGEQWNELLSHSTANTIFLTWEWLYTWWQHFGKGRQLSIMLVEQDTMLVGIAPFFTEKARVRGVIPMQSLQWLGTGEVGSDYLNLIAKPGYEGEVFGAVYGEICRSAKQWDLLRLTDLPQESIPYMNFLARFTNDRDFNCHPGREYICPYIDLKGHSWKSYLESLSGNMRYNLRRRNKQVLEQLGAKVKRCDREENIAPFLDSIFELHFRRWSGRGGSDGFSEPQVRAFHHAAAALLFVRGWLRLYLLEIDQKPVAGVYGLEYGNTFSFYQSGFAPDWDRYSVGMVLQGQTIKDAISNNLTVYDFLHGAEEYKFKWTQTLRRTCSLMVCHHLRLAPKIYLLLRILRQKLSFRRAQKTRR